jgi:hypothetical protein
MLYEFKDALTKIKGLLLKNKAIADNTGVDDIELSVIDIVPVELISSCFHNSDEYRLPSTVAKREAIDIIEGHRRTGHEYATTRSSYYDMSATQAEQLINMYDYTDAVLQRLDRKGTV